MTNTPPPYNYVVISKNCEVVCNLIKDVLDGTSVFINARKPGALVEVEKYASKKTVLLSIENPVIIHQDALEQYKLCLNLHRGNFYDYRGASSLQRQILYGESELCMCLHEMESEVDCGAIYSELLIPVEGGAITYSEATALLRNHYTALLFNTISLLNSGQVPLPQRRVKPSHLGSIHKRRKPKDSTLPYLGSEVCGILMAADNNEWPARFFCEGREFILKVYPVKKEKENDGV